MKKRRYKQTPIEGWRQRLYRRLNSAKKRAGRETATFLQQAVTDGRITEDDKNQILAEGGKHIHRPEPSAPHYNPPKTFISFADHAAWIARKTGRPVEDAYARLTAVLEEKGLDRLAIELYLNSAEYSVEELAEVFHIKAWKVYKKLKQVHEAWPELGKHTRIGRIGQLSVQFPEYDRRILSDGAENGYNKRTKKTYGRATGAPCTDAEAEWIDADEKQHGKADM